MATNLDRLRNLQFGTNSKETAYDTADAVDSLIRMSGGVLPNEQVQTINNSDQIGGTEEASDAELLVQSVSFPFSQARVKPHTAAFVMAFALGDIATTTPSGATNTRKHTITPQTAAAQPSFTMEGLLKSGLQKKWSGMFMDSFNLSAERGANRFLELSGQAYGSGTVTDGTANTSEISEGGLNAADAAIFFDATTYDGSTTDDLDLATNDLTSNPSGDEANMISLEWGYNNNMDLDFLYEIGSGTKFGGSDRLARTQTLTYTRLYQDETYQSGLTNQTEYALQFKVKNAQIESGFFYGIQIVFPLLQIADRQRGESNGRMTETLVFNVLQHATHGSVIVDVFNTQTAYAA